MNTGKVYDGISVVFFCHDKNGRFLMGKRSGNCRDEIGKWDIGSRDFNFYEPTLTILKKGIMEEYGIEILNNYFLGSRKVNRELDDMRIDETTLDFSVLIDDISKARNGTAKLEAIGSFKLSNLPPIKQLHSQLSIFFEEYKDRLKFK